MGVKCDGCVTATPCDMKFLCLGECLLHDLADGDCAREHKALLVGTSRTLYNVSQLCGPRVLRIKTFDMDMHGLMPTFLHMSQYGLRCFDGVCMLA